MDDWKKQISITHAGHMINLRDGEITQDAINNAIVTLEDIASRLAPKMNPNGTMAPQPQNSPVVNANQDLCPVHHKPWKFHPDGKFGPWYSCTSKDNGQWCKQKPPKGYSRMGDDEVAELFQ